MKAVERVAKALVVRQGYKLQSWKDMPLATTAEHDIATKLIALELAKVD